MAAVSGPQHFVPGVPPRIGIRGGELNDVLRAEPWRPRHERDELPAQGLRLVIDDTDGMARLDHPLSFAKADRQIRLAAGQDRVASG